MAARIPDAAIYRQIAATLRARIAAGQLLPGQPIGTMDDLAHEFDRGHGTIRRVMTLLRFEGLVVGEPGQVPRVRDVPEVVTVKVPRGAELPPARLPTEAECATLGISGGMLVVELVYGGRTTLYVCERTRFTFA